MEKPQLKMKTLVFLVLVGFFLQDSTAVTHSWKAFYTGSSGLAEFPEFVAVNLVDDQVMGYFDSRTNKFESKQGWMMEHLGQEYEERQTNILRGQQQTFKANVGILKERFNQSAGIHLYQQMYGCEWDDETQEIGGYNQYGYDGEDLVAQDMKTFTYVAPQMQGVVTKEKWNNNKPYLANQKNYLTHTCPDWLKKYVAFGERSLMRKDIPKVNLLQKTPSSRITCHATGFYPNQAAMFWRKDGDELQDNVEHGEILPNHDGSFQMSVDLELPSDEDWVKYECVFQLSGVKEDIVTKLDREIIKTNYVEPVEPMNLVPIAVGVIIAVIAVVALVIVGFLIHRKKNSQYDKASETSSEVTEKLNPAPQC